MIHTSWNSHSSNNYLYNNFSTISYDDINLKHCNIQKLIEVKIN